jgi:hypothetical protein
MEYVMKYATGDKLLIYVTYSRPQLAVQGEHHWVKVAGRTIRIFDSDIYSLLERPIRVGDTVMASNIQNPHIKYEVVAIHEDNLGVCLDGRYWWFKANTMKRV